MIKNEEKKTSPRQRIVIILIAILMLGSTFALYAGIVLSYNNSSESSTANAQKQARFDELYEEYQAQVDAQAKELSNTYFNEFSQYKNRVKGFNREGALELKVVDLKVGTGREISEISDTDYAAYYIGWLYDETVFDSSFDDFSNPTSLISPLNGSENMIQGWLEGVSRSTEEDGKLIWEGMRIGGVREITVPAALAYGETEQGAIPANSPLKFVVMLIDKPTEVEISEELLKLYEELNG